MFPLLNLECLDIVVFGHRRSMLFDLDRLTGVGGIAYSASPSSGLELCLRASLA